MNLYIVLHWIANEDGYAHSIFNGIFSSKELSINSAKKIGIKVYENITIGSCWFQSGQGQDKEIHYFTSGDELVEIREIEINKEYHIY